jgi:signal-transduction protein with cAMP-binding, CBS, and nucleotidyltransferase domain
MTIHSALAPHLNDVPVHPIVTISPAASLRTAARVIRSRHASLLLVTGADAADAEAATIGAVTEGDLTRALAEGYSPDTGVKDIATPRPPTMPADDTIMDAATLMLRHSIDNALVTQDGRPVGVVYLRDLLARFVQTVTTDTVFLQVPPMGCDRPEQWLG